MSCTRTEDIGTPTDAELDERKRWNTWRTKYAGRVESGVWWRARGADGPRIFHTTDMQPPRPVDAKAEGRFNHFGQSVFESPRHFHRNLVLFDWNEKTIVPEGKPEPRAWNRLDKTDDAEIVF